MCKLELMDLEFNDPKYTWRGTRNGQLVEAQLDRVFVNQGWQAIWLNTMVTHVTVLGFDHCPILMHGDPNVVKGKTLFRFKAFWAKEVSNREIVNQAWPTPLPGKATVWSDGFQRSIITIPI